MSVQSYLDSLSSKLVLSSVERDSITTSISTLSSRLNFYFLNDVREHFQFGSYTRGTILPRKVDSTSDIDYIIIFKNPNGYKPQTLLNYLKQFVSKYYQSSEIYRDSPTMVLELKHIKFELVPAQMDNLGTIYIPAPSTSYTDWMETDPKGFNAKLTRVNSDNGSKIKPLIRLMKYWNKLNRYYYSSFLLEAWLTDINNNYRNNLKEYVYNSFDRLQYNYDDAKYIKDSIDRAKGIINQARSYENQGLPYHAELEIKKLLPDI